MFNIKDMRRAGVPLVAIDTADPAATVRFCNEAINGKSNPIPLIAWDICNGLTAMNPAGKDVIKWYDPITMNLPEILKNLSGAVKPGTLAYFFNVQRFMDRDGVAQGLWNLRDSFKSCGATLVLIGPMIKLPPELTSDVIVISEPSPDAKVILGIVDRIVEAAGKAGAEIKGVNKPEVVGSLLGLASAFDVEQTLSLSFGKSGINIAECWERKIQRLRATTGAEITIKNPTFSDLAGCENVKSELNAFIGGRQKPGVVFFIDEIEKVFAGAGTDLSGVTTSLVGMFLSWTADKAAKGFLFPGVPGAGKTHTARCTAGQAKVPLVKAGDLKGSLVGESESKLRALLNAVDALAGDGAVLLLASCNWVDNIAPDLMARFQMGQFFYDFPDETERASLWKMFTEKLKLPKQKLPESDGWVGREIESACWRAWQYNRPLVDVAKNICPSAISQKSKLEALRRACSGRFLSASKPGLYQSREIEATSPGVPKTTDSRVMSFE